jgi:hypothetical protein
MIVQQLFPRITAGMSAVCLSVAIPQVAQAASVSYTIDPSQSVLNLSGTYSGFAFVPQSPGSMMDGYGGTINADLSGGVVTFLGGSSITALLHPAAATFQPIGFGVGNYGVAIPSIAEFGAYRNLVLDILSGSFSSGGSPTIQLAFTSGGLDYDGPQTGAGTVPLTGLMGPDTSALPAMLSTIGGIETLSIPVSFSFSGANGLLQSLDGTIVAFRPVPEPSPLALGLAGGVVLFGISAFRRGSRRRG